jgi:hypothetical protein
MTRAPISLSPAVAPAAIAMTMLVIGSIGSFNFQSLDYNLVEFPV